VNAKADMRGMRYAVQLRRAARQGALLVHGTAQSS
jgi:hypothetical protein